MDEMFCKHCGLGVISDRGIFMHNVPRDYQPTSCDYANDFSREFIGTTADPIRFEQFLEELDQIDLILKAAEY